jgi:signal transduction histidine kinase
LFQRARRVPLLTKIVVLDMVLNGAAYVLLQQTPPEHVQAVSLWSMVAVMVLNAGLVAWALEPLNAIEVAARRVSQGQYDARVGVLSPIADANLLRVGRTLDELLERVAAERARVRALAAEVVKAGDAERARIARELHDGTAQQLTALEMLLSSARAEDASPALRERLTVMHAIATETLAEVRSLSHTLYPRVLDDLGLAAALDWLVRRTGAGANAQIDVHCALTGPVPTHAASVLYRVAQEALQNAVRHADAKVVRIAVSERVSFGARVALLRVEDDGRGFDAASVRASRRGMGLFVMEERVSLVGGTFAVESRAGEGTYVRAEVPIVEAA